MYRALIAALLLAGSASAGTLSGVTLPDSQTVSGQSLVLNGLGLREKLWFDIYVGGLYLPQKTTSGAQAIGADVPKRIVMHFVYSSGVSASKLRNTYESGFSYDPLGKSLDAESKQFLAMMEDVAAGDQIVIDYLPGTGTTVRIKGRDKGTIAGAAFMKLLFGVYVGPNADSQLRSGMLGG